MNDISPSTVGFIQSATQTVEQTWVLQEPLGIVHGILEGAVRARGLIQKQTESVQQAIFNDVATRMAVFLQDDGSYHVPTPALVCAASKDH